MIILEAGLIDDSFEADKEISPEISWESTFVDSSVSNPQRFGFRSRYLTELSFCRFTIGVVFLLVIPMTILEKTVMQNRRICIEQDDVIYIGADVHERETQLAIFEPGGTLLQEERIPTKDLQSFIQSLPAREKHLALESVGFIYPLYDKLRQIPRCEVAVANPKRIETRFLVQSKNTIGSDAKALGNQIRTNYLKRSYMPGEETREKRFLINDRVKYGLRRAELRGYDTMASEEERNSR